VVAAADALDFLDEHVVSLVQYIAAPPAFFARLRNADKFCSAMQAMLCYRISAQVADHFIGCAGFITMLNAKDLDILKKGSCNSYGYVLDDNLAEEFRKLVVHLKIKPKCASISRFLTQEAFPLFVKFNADDKPMEPKTEYIIDATPVEVPLLIKKENKNKEQKQ